MKQEYFEKQHTAEWSAFSAWIERANMRRKQAAQRTAPFPAEEFPERYRRMCQHLALARDREYSLSLIEHLHTLVRSGHDLLYHTTNDISRSMLAYASGGFARDVRAHRWWILASALLLFGPQLAAMLSVYLNPDLAHLIMSPLQLARFEQMYSPDADSLGRVAREASTDVQMFGFYIFNNIGIAFRCFAGGLTAGLFTIVALVQNGLSFGVVDIHLTQAGLGDNFHSFVIGHSGFEIGAIILSGAAGLRLGACIIAPGQRTRSEALRKTAKSQIGMVCGFACMLVIAALIEAFWSPLRLGLPIKYTVGGILLATPLLYFLLAGRRHES